MLNHAQIAELDLLPLTYRVDAVADAAAGAQSTKRSLGQGPGQWNPGGPPPSSARICITDAPLAPAFTRPVAVHSAAAGRLVDMQQPETTCDGFV